MRKESVVDQIEIRRNGNVQVRIGLQIVNDDGTLAAEPRWHRCVMDPGTDIEAQMKAVNAHLVQMGEKPVETDCVSRIKAHAQIARTPLAATAAQKSTIL